jgi:hypothetical protein
MQVPSSVPKNVPRPFVFVQWNMSFVDRSHALLNLLPRPYSNDAVRGSERLPMRPMSLI